MSYVVVFYFGAACGALALLGVLALAHAAKDRG